MNRTFKSTGTVEIEWEEQPGSGGIHPELGTYKKLYTTCIDDGFFYYCAMLTVLRHNGENYHCVLNLRDMNVSGCNDPDIACVRISPLQHIDNDEDWERELPDILRRSSSTVIHWIMGDWSKTSKFRDISEAINNEQILQ